MKTAMKLFCHSRATAVSKHKIPLSMIVLLSTGYDICFWDTFWFRASLIQLRKGHGRFEIVGDEAARRTISTIISWLLTINYWAFTWCNIDRLPAFVVSKLNEFVWMKTCYCRLSIECSKAMAVSSSDNFHCYRINSNFSSEVNASKLKASLSLLERAS